MGSEDRLARTWHSGQQGGNTSREANLTRPGVMGWPSAAVSAFVSQDRERIMPGCLHDLGRRHDDEAGFALEMGASECDAQIEHHVGAELADVGLIPSRYVDNKPNGIGPIVFLWWQYP
jgi:hypothetical protein